MDIAKIWHASLLLFGTLRRVQDKAQMQKVTDSLVAHVWIIYLLVDSRLNCCLNDFTQIDSF